MMPYRGNDFLKPLVKFDESALFGVENLNEIKELTSKGANVVFLSNHQTEADPQVISLLLELVGHKEMAEKMIFLAGHKVTSDPVCVPFSKGRNLICIHSKKHINNPPEDAASKQAQNVQSIGALNALLAAGGNVVWVAPSGGRDRPSLTDMNRFTVADFDLKTIEMFRMLGAQSNKV
jgi:glycerol-3-phosphate O-acyltransferase